MVEGTFKGGHYRYWAARSSRGLSQCLDSGLPIKHEPILFMRWKGLDPTAASWDFLSVAAAALIAGVGVEPFPSQVLWSVGAPVRCDAQLASSFPTGLFLQRRFVDYPFSLRDEIFLRGLSGWTAV